MASNYYETQGIPKCLGGVVGTHVAKKEPTSTGSSTAPFWQMEVNHINLFQDI